MRISLNLATKPFINVGPILRHLRMGMIALAVLAAALGVGLYIYSDQANAARSRDRALDTQISQIEQERQGYQSLMRQPDNEQLLGQASTLNQLFDEKGFSWTLAMEDLETVLPAGVQVATLEPIRDKSGVITLHMRVNGPRDKSIDLVKNLERSRRFQRPRITGENSAESGSGGASQAPMQPVSASSAVNFDLEAVYIPATLEERKTVSKKPVTEKSATMPHTAAPQNAPVGAKSGWVTGTQAHQVARPPANNAPIPHGGRP